MLSLRGVAAGAVVLFVSGGVFAGASAPTATGDPAGKPLQLLRIIEAPERPKAVARNRIHAALHRAVAMRSLKRHTVVAEAKVEQSQPTAQDAAPPAVGTDDSDATAPTTLATASPAPSPSAPVMGPLVVGNQMVDVASQSEVNALDLAADATANRSAIASSSSANLNDTAAIPAAGDKAAAIPATALATVSDAAAKGDSIKAAPAPAPQPQAAASAVGTPGWIAQVLAAAAGAVAAGSLAWFLIGSAPQRTYG